jgi:hypothetical protein
VILAAPDIRIPGAAASRRGLLHPALFGVSPKQAAPANHFGVFARVSQHGVVAIMNRFI